VAYRREQSHHAGNGFGLQNVCFHELRALVDIARYDTIRVKRSQLNHVHQLTFAVKRCNDPEALAVQL
jgi:hypothetical protein